MNSSPIAHRVRARKVARYPATEAALKSSNTIESVSTSLDTNTTCPTVAPISTSLTTSATSLATSQSTIIESPSNISEFLFDLNLGKYLDKLSDQDIDLDVLVYI